MALSNLPDALLDKWMGELLDSKLFDSPFLRRGGMTSNVQPEDAPSALSIVEQMLAVQRIPKSPQPRSLYDGIPVTVCEAATAVIPEERWDWSGYRSPSRAKRRRDRSKIKMREPACYEFQGKLVMHPQLWDAYKVASRLTP